MGSRILAVNVSLVLAMLAADATIDALTPPPRALTEEARAEVLDATKETSSIRSAWPATFPKLYRGSTLPTRVGGVVPLGGVANVQIVFCDEGNGRASYSSDRFGFRNLDSVWELPSLDALLVGDSFVQGACVQQGESIGEKLVAGHLDVLTLGAAGLGAVGYLALLEEYMPTVPIRQLFWLHTAGNDLDDSVREANDPVLGRYLTAGYSQRLRDRQEPVDAALRDWLTAALREEGEKPLGGRQGALDRLRLVHLRGRIAAIDEGWRREHAESDSWSILLSGFQRAKELARTRGAEFVVVWLPSAEAILGTASEEAQFERLRVMLETLGVRLIDLRPVLVGSENPGHLLPGWRGPHYSAEGYGVVAAEIAIEIREARAQPSE